MTNSMMGPDNEETNGHSKDKIPEDVEDPASTHKNGGEP